MPLRSLALGVAGSPTWSSCTATASGWRPFPVEYKRGRPKAHRADEVQLCAQALCLEEMFAAAVPEGALFYGKTRRRTDVALRRGAARAHRAGRRRARAHDRRRPHPRPGLRGQKRCDACSLLELCRPQAGSSGPARSRLGSPGRIEEDRTPEALPQHALRHHPGRLPEQGRRQHRRPIDGAESARVPIHTLGGLVGFGRVALSPPLLGFCAEEGMAVTFLTEQGRFLARVEGPVSGNVLLRREQYRRSDDPARCAALVRSLVVGKALNQRAVLRRALRDHGETHASLRPRPRSRRPSGASPTSPGAPSGRSRRRRAARPGGRGGATPTSPSSTT